MEILFWSAAIYAAIGFALTIFLFSQTPYSLNPWWLTTLLWPIFLWG